jgi:hypothetical protein
MTDPLTIACPLHFRRHGQGAAKDLQAGKPPAPPVLRPGRLPRVSRLLALAHRFDHLLRSGQVENYTELARRGRVSRARVSQIMQLLLLAPAIQEELLFLPRVQRGRASVRLADLLPMARCFDWVRQRRMWERLRRHAARGAAVGPDPPDLDRPPG